MTERTKYHYLVKELEAPAGDKVKALAVFMSEHGAKGFRAIETNQFDNHMRAGLAYVRILVTFELAYTGDLADVLEELGEAPPIAPTPDASVAEPAARDLSEHPIYEKDDVSLVETRKERRQRNKQRSWKTTPAEDAEENNWKSPPKSSSIIG